MHQGLLGEHVVEGEAVRPAVDHVLVDDPGVVVGQRAPVEVGGAAAGLRGDGVEGGTVQGGAERPGDRSDHLVVGGGERPVAVPHVGAGGPGEGGDLSAGRVGERHRGAGGTPEVAHVGPVGERGHGQRPGGVGAPGRVDVRVEVAGGEPAGVDGLAGESTRSTVPSDRVWTVSAQPGWARTASMTACRPPLTSWPARRVVPLAPVTLTACGTANMSTWVLLSQSPASL